MLKASALPIPGTEAPMLSLRWVQPPVTQPDFDYRVGETQFNLKAIVAVPAELAARLQWRVYSNRPADFGNNRPQQAGSFLLSPGEPEVFAISARANMVLPQGLYYFLVEDPQGGEIYFVGKFTVD